MYAGKRILITGGTGSWGQVLTRKLLQEGAREIIIFSRNEAKQVEMSRNFNNPKIRYVIGDVRDYDRLLEATEKVNIIFHLAALKHVPICEEYPGESIKTNVTGAQNVIIAAKVRRLERVIYISTDKAVAPLNAYGMCKGLAEKLFVQANKNSDTKFITIRAGNVLNTSGSVIPFFIDKIEWGLPLPVTSMEMTRFYLTLDQAINLVLLAAKSNALGGELFVVKMPSFRMEDIIKLVYDIKKVEPDKQRINIIGLRPGEKLHEVLISEDECDLSYCYSGDYVVIIPPWPELLEHYKDYTPFRRSMTSQTNLDTYHTLASLYKLGTKE